MFRAVRSTPRNPAKIFFRSVKTTWKSNHHIINFDQSHSEFVVHGFDEDNRHVTLLFGSIPDHVKQLSFRWCDYYLGFDAITISGLTHLHVGDLCETMEFPETLENLFIRANPKELPYPKVKNLFIHASLFESVEKSGIGEHYLFYYGDSEICAKRLVSKKYECIGNQQVVTLFGGEEYTVIKRVPKQSPPEPVSGPTHMLIRFLDEYEHIPKTVEHLFVRKKADKIPYPNVPNLYLHASDYDSIEYSDIGKHYLFHYGDELISKERLVSEKYECVGKQYRVIFDSKMYTVIKRVPKDDYIPVQLEAIRKTLEELSKKIDLTKE